tara:strand:- start:96 stop:470 length:375 start_codon:yes stop_codon:yes gene_type:complete
MRPASKRREHFPQVSPAHRAAEEALEETRREAAAKAAKAVEKEAGVEKVVEVVEAAETAAEEEARENLLSNPNSGQVRSRSRHLLTDPPSKISPRMPRHQKTYLPRSYLYTVTLCQCYSTSTKK